VRSAGGGASIDIEAGELKGAVKMSAMTSQYAKLDANQQDIKPQQQDAYQEHQRRFYEVCIVFKCKTTKNVKYDETDNMMQDQGRTLMEPTDEDKEKMQMWKARREAILKSLQNCGLHLFCYYSRDRDEVIVKIGASPQKLRDTAARMKYKLQLKKQYLNAYAEYRHDFPGRPERQFKDRRVISHIYKTHTEDDFPDSDAIFKTLDKVNLIHHIITSKDKDCAGINIGKLLHEKELVSYFPLHEANVIAELKMNKLQWFLMPEDFANKIRDYFGDRIAFYFLFMAFYWKWLVPIAIVGLALQFIDVIFRTPDNITAIPFCILMSVWSTFLPYFWRRQEAKYAIGWGTLDLVESLEPCRPEHYGDPRINPVTAQVEPYYPWQKRILSYVKSYSLMAFTSVLVIFCALMIVLSRHNMRDSTPGGLWTFQLLLALFVEVTNGVLTRMTRWLTTNENHRTQSEHETHMLAKVMVLKFVTSYFVLYYTAFFKHHSYIFDEPMECYRGDCFLDLQWQLATFVFFRLTISNLYEWFEPKVKLWWRSLFHERNSVMTTLHSTLSGHTLLELADMSAAEQQAKKDKYDEFRNFDEVLLSHGFSTFFAVSSPWVCAATLVASLVEIAVDMKSLMDSRQRPIPRKARSNEPWSTAFDLYGVMAASTNIVLLIFASNQYDDWTFTEKLVLFIYLEHMILLARMLLKLIFPEVPRNVELLQLKQDNMVHRCLENIKVEQNQDFSMFRDHREHNIEVFEFDIMERDEDEEVEPTLNLQESTMTMVSGFQDESSRWLPRSKK
jgi:hypothetical protein